MRDLVNPIAAALRHGDPVRGSTPGLPTRPPVTNDERRSNRPSTLGSGSVSPLYRRFSSPAENSSDHSSHVPKAFRMAALWNADDRGMTLRYREVEKAAQVRRRDWRRKVAPSATSRGY